MVDPVGQVFHRLVVIQAIGWRRGHFRVVARCECGTEKEFSLDLLKSGSTKACGCMRRDRAHTLNQTHRQAGPGRTPLYRAWEGMHRRCRIRPEYRDRGISVDPAWDTFEAFRDYVESNLGERPAGHTLDRRDNDRGYEPGNIRWASAGQQVRNTRANTVITVNGVTRCIAEWAEASGLTPGVICARRRNGWPDHVAVTAPVHSRRPKDP